MEDETPLQQLEELARNHDRTLRGEAVHADEGARVAEHGEHRLEPVGFVERGPRRDEGVRLCGAHDDLDTAGHRRPMDAQPGPLGLVVRCARRGNSCQQRAPADGCHERAIIYDMRAVTFKIPFRSTDILLGLAAQPLTARLRSIQPLAIAER